MLSRERPCTPIRALMPAPTSLPSLSFALARRASVFGPFDGDEPSAPSLGLLARYGRRLASLYPGVSRSSPQRYQTTAAAGPASKATPTIATMHCSHIGNLALRSSGAVTRCPVIVSSPRLPARLQ